MIKHRKGVNTVIDISNIKIYFSTNRRPNRQLRPTRFGKDFNLGGPAAIRFGTAYIVNDAVTLEVSDESLVVEIPKLRTIDEKSRFGSLEIFNRLREEMWQENKDTVIFVHGYNVSFREAILDAAKMYHNFNKFNNYRGINVALFSWPSDGSMKPWIAYANDRHDAAVSGPAFARGLLKLVDFLQGMSRSEACEQDIHLVAHSMGNYVLRHALQEMIRHIGHRLPRLFNKIFLMAADEDDDAFEHDHKLKWLPRIANQVNVYFNRGDIAMAISDRTKGNPNRLGDNGPRLPSNVPARVTQIDCTGVVKGPVKHSYYNNNDIVISDMVQVLNGVEADKIPHRRFRPDSNCYVLEEVPR